MKDQSLFTLFRQTYGREPSGEELEVFKQMLDLMKASDPATCPNCHAIVPAPYKKWRMRGLAPLLVKQYVCPKCHTYFRVVIKRKEGDRDKG